MALIEGKQMVTVAKLRLLETRIEVQEMKKKMMAVMVVHTVIIFYLDVYC